MEFTDLVGPQQSSVHREPPQHTHTHTTTLPHSYSNLLRNSCAFINTLCLHSCTWTYNQNHTDLVTLTHPHTYTHTHTHTLSTQHGLDRQSNLSFVLAFFLLTSQINNSWQTYWHSFSSRGKQITFFDPHISCIYVCRNPSTTALTGKKGSSQATCQGKKTPGVRLGAQILSTSLSSHRLPQQRGLVCVCEWVSEDV